MREIAELFKAIGEENRLRILNLLANRGDICVCDLMKIVEAPQGRVSRHLLHTVSGRAELFAAGLPGHPEENVPFSDRGPRANHCAQGIAIRLSLERRFPRRARDSLTLRVLP